MADIFDNPILCKKCNRKMNKTVINKNGLELRAIVCNQCKETIVHPADLNSAEDFKNLKDKTYNVKLRVVGNSHAISIPKEIVEFIQHHEKIMDNMVRLCFEDMHKLSLIFSEKDQMEDW